MTDNEKRAHDLAIASIQIIYDSFISNARNNDANNSITFDAYAEYLKAYNVSLENFNHDFPSNK